MIDPKKLELSTYKRLQGYHLITSESIDEYVITTPKNAIHALRSAELEMEKRYNLLSKQTVRNIEQYNERATGKDGFDPLPYIVVLVDELADLMITAGKEIEEPIARLAQMARAAGIRKPKPITTHVLRHSFACNALLAGVPITTVQLALGHSSLRTTEIYLKAIQNQEQLKKDFTEHPLPL